MNSKMEVRVGDTDVSIMTDDPGLNRMCVNKLCFTSGEESLRIGSARAMEGDCALPLNGR